MPETYHLRVNGTPSILTASLNWGSYLRAINTQCSLLCKSGALALALALGLVSRGTAQDPQPPQGTHVESSRGNNYIEAIFFNLQAGGHGWQVDATYNNPTDTMTEYVPTGQTGKNWSEMITTIIGKNQPEMNTGLLITNIVQSFQTTCGTVKILEAKADTKTDPVRDRLGLPASYQTFTALVRCDDPRAAPNRTVTLKKHEVVWFKGIQGWLTTYIVQRAWHGDEIPPDSILASDSVRGDWRDWIDSVTIGGAPDDKHDELGRQLGEQPKTEEKK